MAQAAVNAVIQAFQRGMEQVQQAHAQKQQREEYEKNLEFQKQEQADRKEQLAVQNAANEKLFGLQKAQLDAQQAQTELANAQSFQRSGIASPGTQVIPGMQAPQFQSPQLQIPQISGQPAPPQQAPQPQKPLVLSDLQNAQLISNRGNTLTVPPLSQSPENLLVQQQLRDAEQAKTRESQATQAAETTRQLAVGKQLQEEETKRFLAQINASKTFDLERARIEEGGRNARNAQDNQFRMRDAMINATGGLSEMWGGFGGGGQRGPGGGMSITTGPDGQPNFKSANLPLQLNNNLTSLFNGDTSLEELEKVNPKIKQPLASLSTMFGIGSLTQKDRAELHYLELLQPSAKILQQLHQLKLSDPNKINIPGTKSYSDFNSLQKQIDTMIPRIAKEAGGRISEPELKRFFDGLTPSRNPLQKGSSEIEKYNRFITDDLWSRGKSLTEGLSKSQQDAILSKHGFTGLPGLLTTDPTTEKRFTRDSSGKLVPVGK